MFGAIARFELRYQLRNPVFWAVTILFFLMTFGAMTIDQMRLGSGGGLHKNAATAIARIHITLSIFYMFVTTAFVANVIVRDDESGFGQIVRSTRVTKSSYLLARYLGAFGAAAISFAAVPVAMWLGTLMPWVDPVTLGPNRPADYLFAYVLLALPNLFLTGGIFFAVATATRSMTYSYLAVIGFLVAYLALLSLSGRDADVRGTLAYLEPFGIVAFGWVTRYWTAVEANAGMPAFDGVLAANRLLALALGVVALGVAWRRFSFAERGASTRRLRREARRATRLAATPPQVAATLPTADPAGARWAQLRARTGLEMALIFRSPAFAILMLLGLANATSVLAFPPERFGTPTLPLTFVTIGILQGAFATIPLVIAIYYAGELVWRDRERRIHEIVDATALPNWGYLVPKTLAVAGVLTATLVASALLAVLIQLIRGPVPLEPGKYLAWYVLPGATDYLILALLAVFVQAVSPNKYVGWGVMLIHLVATSTFVTLGWDHPLYLYGSTGWTGPVPLSDMNGDAVGGARAWWLRLYWGGWALVLAVAAHLLWRRGTAITIGHRFRLATQRLRGGAGAVLAVALTVVVGSGAYAYRQMDVLNTYRSAPAQEARAAAYEKKYLRYAALRQPTLTGIRLTVALHPAELRMEADGRYAWLNDTGAPLRDLHVRMQGDRTRLIAVDVPGARLASDDADFQYRIYRFDRPVAPGATGTLAFRTERVDRGFAANADDTRLVANGTFLNNREFAPAIGMDRTGLLQDPVTRRKHGLRAELRPAKLEDTAAQRRNLILADWVRSDITMSTDADQVPIAPGRKVSDVTTGARRTARFVSGAPILSFFSVQSARYAEKSRVADGVRLSVFHHPAHDRNTDRMLTAMQRALAYYRANFGPYQFPDARVVEFPGYASYAQAFAGTIPYSERAGFIADTRSPDRIDYVTYVTAHELAHQYWAHQMIGADMQGGTLWTETLAQYSALMVMRQLYGPDKIRRFLKYELDSYLRGRGGAAIEEQPLVRVENQPYIHYNKGSLAMYLLQERFGEARVNAVLRDMLDRYRFKRRPYPRSTDLIAGFKTLARTPEERQLIADLFERITLWDLKASAATARRLPDGRWETMFTVDAAKLYADGRGRETPAPLADTIDIGAFTSRPGLAAFSSADVLTLERRPVRNGTQRVRIVTTERPAYVGVDPYNTYVDRNGDDNLVAVD